MNELELAGLETRLHYRFRDPALLGVALTHASFANEQALGGEAHYDRLEFLGDAVIGLLIAEHEYRAEPAAPSGEMSRRRARLARRTSLAAAGERLGLGAAARLSGGERDHGGPFRRRLLADLYESVIGAVYLDGGLHAAREVLSRTLVQGERPADPLEDFKSALQERVQATGTPAPVYRVVESGGPPHAPTFLVEVEFDGRVAGRGTGGSKREAEQAAARVALASLEH
jgi:ribonuclease-3